MAGGRVRPTEKLKNLTYEELVEGLNIRPDKARRLLNGDSVSFGAGEGADTLGAFDFVERVNGVSYFDSSPEGESGRASNQHCTKVWVADLHPPSRWSDLLDKLIY